jgi:hypothetical protein
MRVADRVHGSTAVKMSSRAGALDRVTMMGELADARAAQNFLNMQPPDVGEVREALGCIVGDVGRARDVLERIREHMKKRRRERSVLISMRLSMR